MELFPKDVIKFLYENVESIDQLEILRILDEDHEKIWDSVTLAREVQAPAPAVRAHLAAMHGRGLLVTMPHGASLFCRHGASRPELEAMIARLLQLYKERPVTMIKVVYERAKDPLRFFADAFRIRKED